MQHQAGKPKRVTLVDVAARAGVSVATASRVFDAKWEGKIKDGTRAAVLRAADELGYYGANALARGLLGNRTNIVALVVGSFNGYHYLEVTMKFVQKLQETGRQVLIFEADPTKDMKAICAQIHQYCVDAIIVTAAATSDTIIDEFLDTAIPVLVFGRQVQDSNISAVFSDEYFNAQKAADFLLHNGHTRFGLITGNANSSTASDRINGFTEAVKAGGGEILVTVDGDYTYASGYACMGRILENHRPDAVFCAEDSIALGAIDAARRQFGLEVPGDISVMGFDNIAIGAFEAYQLTSMAFPVDKMVSSAIEIIQRLIDRPESQVERIYDMELVVRDSVRLARL